MSNIEQTSLSLTAHHPSGRKSGGPQFPCHSANPSEWEGSSQDPSPLVFELCTAIDRFYEREPDLSVSDVLEALGEVSMALACKRSRTHWSRANVVSISDYKRRTGGWRGDLPVR